MTKPYLGQVVIYRSKIDNGPGNDVCSPAIVTRTYREYAVAQGDERGQWSCTEPS